MLSSLNCENFKKILLLQLFSFRLEPKFDQAADGFGAARKVILLAAPIID
jgi:hypothetical protein